MRLLYTIGIYCYAAAVYVASPFNSKAKMMVAGWKRTFSRLTVASVGNGKTAWFHASSLGEFEQTRPVLERFRQLHPEYKVCVTFFSPSGYEIRKNYKGADFICYLPMDTRANASRFVNLLRPTVALFAKYDYWFNYLEQLRLREVPTYIYSAIYRPEQYFFKPYGRWFLKQIDACFTQIFVQNNDSLQLLMAHGVKNCSVAGDTRFDRVAAIASDTAGIDEIERFLGLRQEGNVVVAGSTWPHDEEHLLRYLNHRGDSMTLIMAPHEFDETRLSAIQEQFGKKRCVLFSHIAEANSGTQVLVMDNVGMLSRLYRYGRIAYIGGGFGRGIHNTLEAIVYGKPVVFGPNSNKFKEARDIVGCGGGFRFESYGAFEQWADSMMDDEAAYSHASEACKEYTAANVGATEQILEKLNLIS